MANIQAHGVLVTQNAVQAAGYRNPVILERKHLQRNFSSVVSGVACFPSWTGILGLEYSGLVLLGRQEVFAISTNLCSVFNTHVETCSAVDGRPPLDGATERLDTDFNINTQTVFEQKIQIQHIYRKTDKDHHPGADRNEPKQAKASTHCGVERDVHRFCHHVAFSGNTA